MHEKQFSRVYVVLVVRETQGCLSIEKNTKY